ncbi:MAG: cytochrome c3 family protein [Parvularculaceae bacterium]
MLKRVERVALLSLTAAATATLALAAPVSDVRNTKHNLSVSGAGDVRAVSEDEICVFCHTPHAATDSEPTPLWNRSLSTATYVPYDSSSMDAVGLGQPGGSSKLCLSCHDGTIAIGSVNVLNGAKSDTNPLTAEIAMTGTAPDGTMPEGAGAETGFTRRLGIDLTNDHPISFRYDDALALADGELRAPSSETQIDNRAPGVRPLIPLTDDDLQCTSCHDPHVRDDAGADIKFLRVSRLQNGDPVAGFYREQIDIICLACHEKNGWPESAHAHRDVADELYATTAANLREFPDGLPVWRGACLNCHDTHTVEGARRLLREGANSTATPKFGGSSAIEETCYQCHSAFETTLVGQGGAGFEPPDIETDFLSARHMPIELQPEVHDIGTGGEPQPGMDFLESRSLLGTGGALNRHVECTDCHNPHRVTRNRLFNASPTAPDIAGTHDHSGVGIHTNLASGVLRGSWGVEPVYSSTEFLSEPVDFTLKRGLAPVAAPTDKASSYVTREYQVCLKCHSTYAYSTPPQLGGSPGGTASGTNDVTAYTDQAMEFQAPVADQGEPGGNHRSWHPVLDRTRRTPTDRNLDPTNWIAPWNGTTEIGEQTMYCSDCHGSETAAGDSAPVGGDAGRSWGPHGSNNDFILKGPWNQQTGGGGTEDHLCFKCHSFTRYATRDGADFNSGFAGPDRSDANLHGFHADKIGRLRCTWCHVAVPHGWKDKAFLVNLNDVGPEAGLAPGTQVRNNTTDGFTSGPYYLNAMLKVRTFATSGAWRAADCGSDGAPGNGQVGRDWMRDSSENCENPP